MAIISHPRGAEFDLSHPELAALRSPTHQAYRILHAAFVVAPLVAGIDKFYYALCDWTQYLAPAFPQLLGISKHSFMLGVGVVEIVAALVVLFSPLIGGYLVMAWLWGIIVNLLVLQGYYDVALRDFGLSLGALALARLALADRVRRPHQSRANSIVRP